MTICMANLSAWQTYLHGKPVCMVKLSAWQTFLHGKPFCMANLSALLVPVCLAAHQVFSLPL
jgi:hypothetical protein